MTTHPEHLLDNKDPDTTKKNNESVMASFFLSYCREKNIDFNLNQITKLELDNLLKKFYLEARKPNGELYRKNILTIVSVK